MSIQDQLHKLTPKQRKDLLLLLNKTKKTIEPEKKETTPFWEDIKDVQFQQVLHNSKNKKNTINNIFLTGITGYLGAHLAYQLLIDTPYTIYCLIRCQTQELAIEKIKKTLQSYHLWSNKFNKRLIPILGDLTKPLLGIQNPLKLTKKIDIIYHCAALVNFTLPYKTLKSTNVTGTKSLLEFSQLSHSIPIHYTSTYSVFLSQNLKDNTIFESKELNNTPPNLLLGYSQSKWVSEKIINNAQNKNYPITIYRLGNITGDSNHGIYNTKDLLTNILTYCLETKTYPNIEFMVDMSPINFVTKALVELSLKQVNEEKIIHIVNPHPTPWTTLIEEINQIGLNLTKLTELEWLDSVKKQNNINPHHPLSYFSPLLNHPNFKLNSILFPKGTKLSIQSLDKNIQSFCPKVNLSLLAVYQQAFSYKQTLNKAFKTPHTHTLNTIKRLNKINQPFLLPSFLNPYSAKAGKHMAEYYQFFTKSNHHFYTTFTNSRYEALDGIIKLCRHYSKKNKKETPHKILILDTNNELENYIIPYNNKDIINIRPGISTETTKEEFFTKLATIQSKLAAVIIIMSPNINSTWLSTLYQKTKDYQLPIITDLSRYNINTPPPLIPEIDGIIMGENLTNNQVPIGSFSATKKLYKVWHTIDNCLLHTSTFSGNRLSMTLALFNIKKAYPNKKKTTSPYRDFSTYINPKLALLFKLIGTTTKIKKAIGSYLYFKNKKNTPILAIDALGSFGSNLRGHNPKDIPQLLDNFNPKKEYWIELCNFFKKETHFNHFFPAVSGATSVDNALTLSLLAKPQRNHIIMFKEGYAGKTLLSLSGTEKEKYQTPFTPLYNHISYIDPFQKNAESELKNIIATKNINLIWFELIQGEAGIKPIPPSLLNQIQLLKESHDFLVGIDEIQTGLYRTGPLFNYQIKSVTPDIITCSKSLSDMTFPIAITLITETVYKNAQKKQSRLL